MTYKELRASLAARLSGRVESPDAEADLILQFAEGVTAAAHLAHPEAPAKEPDAALVLAEKRTAGEPLQYLFGKADFYNITLRVDGSVLIPRADTEILVERAIKTLPEGAVFADICSGSGAIAAAVLYNRPDTYAVLCEYSPAALSLSRENLAALGLCSRAEFYAFDALSAADYGKLPPLHAILCNPPYIETGRIPFLPADVQKEPPMALDGGEDGLLFYREITRHAAAFFERLGRLPHILYEIGYDQREAVLKIAGSYGLSCRILRDYGGNDRVAELTATTN